jgi:hypothetical protein
MGVISVRRHRVISLGLVTALGGPGTARAASISSVSGAVADGSVVTISGTSFGADGPVIEVFDDFERGSDGALIATGPGSAQVGQWDGINRTPRYSSEAAHSGALSSRGQTETVGTYAYDQMIRYFTQHSRHMFLSFWVFVPTSSEWPMGPQNWKMTWPQGGTDGGNDDDVISPAIIGADAASAWWSITGNTVHMDGMGYDTFEITPDFVRGRWWHAWLYLNTGTDDRGYDEFDELAQSGVRRNTSRGPQQFFEDDCVAPPCGVLERIYITGWMPSGPGISQKTWYWDDVYVATGAAARARVEIGNGHTWTSSTNLSLCTPTSWSDTSVSCTVRRGSFASGDDAYLFVIGADGSISDQDPSTPGAQGFPVSFGGTNARPSPPESLDVQ